MSQNAIVVLAEVADRIKNGKDDVRARLVNVLVERELTSRVDLLDKALAKHGELTKAMKKIKPDVETFDATGAKLEQFSKAKFEEKKKAEDQVTKLEAALELAFNGDFGKLKELVGKGGNSGGETKTE
jgi:hypothetical protein